MKRSMLSRRDLDFLLHEWLNVQSLCDRARFASLRRDHFDAVLAQASRLARDVWRLPIGSWMNRNLG